MNNGESTARNCAMLWGRRAFGSSVLRCKRFLHLLHSSFIAIRSGNMEYESVVEFSLIRKLGLNFEHKQSVVLRADEELWTG